MYIHKFFKTLMAVGAIFIYSLISPLDASGFKQATAQVEDCQKFSDWKLNKHWVEIKSTLGSENVIFQIQLDAQELVSFKADKGDLFEIVEEASEQMLNSICTLTINGKQFTFRRNSVLLTRKDFEPYKVKNFESYTGDLDAFSTAVTLYLNHYGSFSIDRDDFHIDLDPEEYSIEEYLCIDMEFVIEDEKYLETSPGESRFTFRSLQDDRLIYAHGQSLDSHWTPSSEQLASAWKVVNYYDNSHNEWYDEIKLDNGNGQVFEVEISRYAQILFGDRLICISRNGWQFEFINLRTFQILHLDYQEHFLSSTNIVLKKTWPPQKTK